MRKILIAGVFVVLFFGVGLMSWLPNRLGREMIGRTEESAFDYIRVNAERNIPKEAFLLPEENQDAWDRFVTEFMAEGEILDVKSYDRAGNLIYSSGRTAYGGDNWKVVAAGRKPQTEIGMIKRVEGLSGNEESLHAMRLNIPIYKNMNMMGFMEVVQDVQFIYRQARNVQTVAGVVTLLLLLFMSLALIRISRQETVQLERENVSLRQYESGVAHEVRTPLASIKGFATALLEDGALDENKRHEYLEIIVSESNRLSRELDDLLNLERIESGRIILHKRPVRIDALVQESVSRVSREAQARKVKLETRLPQKIQMVNVDNVKMVQAMGNLLITSVMRSMAGGKVSIGADYTDKGVRFDVKDKGVGLSAEDISHMFDKFRWTEPEKQSRTSGLELPLAKAIVEAHAGRIEVESPDGQGALFSFDLPLAEREKVRA